MPCPAQRSMANASAKATRNCGTSLPRPVSPRLRRRLNLMKSSAKPTAPNATSVASPIQTKRLARSIQRKVATITARRMSTPPIVGVPALTWCDFGPSSRIDWPICRRVSSRIMDGPSARARSSAVTAAIAARNVMYRKTLNAGTYFASGKSSQ